MWACSPQSRSWLQAPSKRRQWLQQPQPLPRAASAVFVALQLRLALACSASALCCCCAGVWAHLDAPCACMGRVGTPPHGTASEAPAWAAARHQLHVAWFPRTFQRLFNSESLA